MGCITLMLFTAGTLPVLLLLPAPLRVLLTLTKKLLLEPR